MENLLYYIYYKGVSQVTSKHDPQHCRTPIFISRPEEKRAALLRSERSSSPHYFSWMMAVKEWHPPGKPVKALITGGRPAEKILYRRIWAGQTCAASCDSETGGCVLISYESLECIRVSESRKVGTRGFEKVGGADGNAGETERRGLVGKEKSCSSTVFRAVSQQTFIPSARTSFYVLGGRSPHRDICTMQAQNNRKN